MMNYKKTFLGSIVAFILGTSCCWLSSLAIWIGGAAVLGTIANFIEDIQVFLIVGGAILLLISGIFYWQKISKDKNLSSK